MSELQLAIALLGALGVGGVVAYNAWVARRHRRIGERVLPPVAGDALLESGNAGADDGVVEPVTVPADDPQPASPPRVEPVMSPAGGRSKGAAAIRPEPQLLSADFDYLMTLSTLDAIPGEQLLSLAGDLARAHQHRVAVLGFDDATLRWAPVDVATGRDRVLAGLQLADRQGPTTDAEIAMFSGAVRRFANAAMAVVDAPPVQAAAEQARQLDALCARVDTQVGINVVGRNMAFSLARLRTLLERHANDFAPDGSAMALDGAGLLQFTVLDHDGQSLAPDGVAGATIRGLTFLLDVPRVAEGERVFGRMVQVARDFAGTLGGELVDDQRLPLTDAALDAIGRQIGQQQHLMTESGIAPGGPLARRLFA
jgi:hypothetical protein